MSDETIYQSLFVQGRGALREELARCLRSGRAATGQGLPRAARRAGPAQDMVLLSERPPEIEDRAVPGHWEGDLIMGRQRPAIATLVERRHRYLLLAALPDDGADAVRMPSPSGS